MLLLNLARSFAVVGLAVLWSVCVPVFSVLKPRRAASLCSWCIFVVFRFKSVSLIVLSYPSETAFCCLSRSCIVQQRVLFYVISIYFSCFTYILLWPPCVADADIIFLPCGFLYFFSSPNLSRRRLDVYLHTQCCLSANFRCRFETCCTRLAEKTGCKKSPSGHRCTTFSGYMFASKARIDNRKETC